MKNEIEHSLCLFIIIILLQLDNIFIKINSLVNFIIFKCIITLIVVWL